jgi:hypothetical protein
MEERGLAGAENDNDEDLSMLLQGVDHVSAALMAMHSQAHTKNAAESNELIRLLARRPAAPAGRPAPTCSAASPQLLTRPHAETHTAQGIEPTLHTPQHASNHMHMSVG